MSTAPMSNAMDWFQTTSVGVANGLTGLINKTIPLFTNRFDPFAPSFFTLKEPWAFTTDFYNSDSIQQSHYDYKVDIPWQLDTRFGPGLLYNGPGWFESPQQAWEINTPSGEYRDITQDRAYRDAAKGGDDREAAGMTWFEWQPPAYKLAQPQIL